VRDERVQGLGRHLLQSYSGVGLHRLREERFVRDIRDKDFEGENICHRFADADVHEGSAGCLQGKNA